jgi:hypothetical protein
VGFGGSPGAEPPEAAGGRMLPPRCGRGPGGAAFNTCYMPSGPAGSPPQAPFFGRFDGLFAAFTQPGPSGAAPFLEPKGREGPPPWTVDEARGRPGPDASRVRLPGNPAFPRALFSGATPVCGHRSWGVPCGPCPRTHGEIWATHTCGGRRRGWPRALLRCPCQGASLGVPWLHAFLARVCNVQG